MFYTRSHIIGDFIENLIWPIEDFVYSNQIIAIILGIGLVIAMTVLMAVVFNKHKKGIWKAFIPILNIIVLFRIAFNNLLSALSIPYIFTLVIIILGYLKGYEKYLPYEYLPEGLRIYALLMPYAIAIFIILTVVVVIKAITSIGKVEYVYDTPEDDSDDAELQPPGACLDAPLTTLERQIAQSIREKRRIGQKNFTAEEKAVLHKLAWQKEYGMSKGE